MTTAPQTLPSPETVNAVGIGSSVLLGDGCQCQECGKRFRVDLNLPDGAWNTIRPTEKPIGGGVLCGWCIVNKLEARGFAAFELREL